MGRRLFLGYDDGEWGGDLVALDIDSGALVELEGMNPGSVLPVRALTFDRRGRLWTARGLSHLGGSEGGLYRHLGNGSRIREKMTAEERAILHRAR
jgi:hypothetical protein